MTAFRHKLIFSFIAATFVVGCNSTPETNASKMGMTIPDWVTNPKVDSGLIASSCVVASNSFNIDRDEATTQARAELATQIETRVTSLQEEYSKKVTSMGKSVSESTFMITRAQLTDQYLRGSKVEKVDYADMGGTKNLCALVTLSEERSKDLFSQLIKNAPIELDPENETLLYLNFMKSEQSQ